MTSETANRINSAACSLWFFQQGIIERISNEVVLLLQSVSVTQLQTASDVVQAENEHAPSVDGKRMQCCTLDPSGAARLKAYANSLQT